MAEDVNTDGMTDMLLVLDEKKKKVSAVSGIDENGNLQTVEATNANVSDFMKVDKNSSVFTNFFKNFMERVKNPVGLSFFKSPVSEAIPNAEKIQNAVLLPNPTLDTLVLLEKLKVEMKEVKPDKQKKSKAPEQTKAGKAGKPEKQASPTPQPEQKQAPAAPRQSEPQQPSPTPNKPEQSETKAKAPDQQTNEQTKKHYFDENKINWDVIKLFGVTKQDLTNAGTYDRMLDGKRSKGLHEVKGNFDSFITKYPARLFFRYDKSTDKVVLAAEGINPKPDFKNEFFGHTFTPEDEKKLRETGNMGRIALLTYPKTGEIVPSYISIDPVTNCFVQMRVSEKLYIPDEISHVKLTPEQKQLLREGQAIEPQGMTNKEGKPFSCPIQISAIERGLDYRFDKTPKQTIGENGEKILYAKQIKGVPVSPGEVKKLNDGGYLELKDMQGKQGSFSSYVTWDSKEGTLRFPSKRPDSPKQANGEKTGQGQTKKPIVKGKQIDGKDKKIKQDTGKSQKPTDNSPAKKKVTRHM